MGQVMVPQTDTATYGVNVVISPAVRRDIFANNLTVHFENQDAAAQGFSVRLYWTATDTFDYLNEIGSQVSGNHAYLSPVDVTFSLSGVSAGYLWGWWGMDSPGFSGTITWWMIDDVTYCAYGAQRKTGGPSSSRLRTTSPYPSSRTLNRTCSSPSSASSWGSSSTS